MGFVFFLKKIIFGLCSQFLLKKQLRLGAFAGVAGSPGDASRLKACSFYNYELQYPNQSIIRIMNKAVTCISKLASYQDLDLIADNFNEHLSGHKHI